MKSAATSLVRRTERLSLHLLYIAVLLIVALPASAGTGLNVKTTSPGDGETVSGSVTWEVTVSSGNVDHVDFAIDGVVKWSENVAPWQYNGVAGGLNTTQLSDGTHQLTAKAFAKNGKATGSSAVSVKVANAAAPTPPPPPPPPPPNPSTPPTLATLPSISGTPTVGQTLSATLGTWLGSTPMTYSFGWVRCGSTGGNCSPVSGTTSATYATTSADAGSTIRVTVNATNGAGSATATSAATAVITQTPSGPVTPPTNLGTSLPPRMPESSGNTTLYVSTTGNDSNAGTLASPLKSLSKAFELAASGTIIYVRQGTYTGVQFVNHRRFNPLDPVTLESYPGEWATFVGQTAYANAVEFDDSQAIRIRDITIAARTNTNLKLVSSQHIEVDHIVSRDSGRGCDPNASGVCGGQGIYAGGGPGSGGQAFTYIDDLQIWNSVFTNNGGTTTGVAGSSSHDHGMYLCGGPNDGTEVGCRSFVVANNLIYDQPDGYGIQIGQAARNGIITNNTFNNVSHGSDYAGCAIKVWGTGSYADANDLIVNNIFSNNAANAVCATLGKSLAGNVVRNNLGFNNTTTCDWCRKGVSYDPTYGSYTGFAVGTNSPAADPLYVNSSGAYASLTKDFHLRTGSPALALSIPAYTPPLDFDGVPRSSLALGAFN
jgi:Big-like domain-containing protein/uncharacterized protein DUF1565